MLRETVQDHLLADIEVGMFLSGGVDSSLIAKYMPSKSRAFTVSSSNESLSEELYAQRVADKYSLKLDAIIPEELDIQDALNEWMYYNDDPVRDPSLLSKEVAGVQMSYSSASVFAFWQEYSILFQKSVIIYYQNYLR